MSYIDDETFQKNFPICLLSTLHENPTSKYNEPFIIPDSQAQSNVNDAITYSDYASNFVIQIL